MAVSFNSKCHEFKASHVEADETGKAVFSSELCASLIRRPMIKLTLIKMACFESKDYVGGGYGWWWWWWLEELA